ncbi:MAG: Nif3-like dinuclear metal center hexameric protein [Prevotellaceae bacterium]|jgi:dinuclear metal center YbgI/SA1388 family protein|nr:Nif3-like dinuclear metal center hexameric protein [Prevotellaceae bacterium]
MKLLEITAILEKFAPLALQENFDNSGLLIGDENAEICGALLCIDITEEVIDEAISLGFNLVIAHHPLIFKGLKKINGKNYIERCVQKAIKNDIALYAAHTNFDSVQYGVSCKMAEKIGLENLKVLSPCKDVLVKIVTFLPVKFIENVRTAAFEAGSGHIGNYESCSFSAQGEGTFRALDGAKPFLGKVGEMHTETENRLEFIVPAYLADNVMLAIKDAHPYEEPAIDIFPLKNAWESVGLGVVGMLKNPMSETEFLTYIKQTFGVGVIRHSKFLNKPIVRAALCGGSGAEFINNAKRCRADIYVTADVSYHKFFEAENSLVIADIGHFESEQFTKEIFYEILLKNFKNFAVEFSKNERNAVEYF